MAAAMKYKTADKTIATINEAIPVTALKTPKYFKTAMIVKVVNSEADGGSIWLSPWAVKS